MPAPPLRAPSPPPVIPAQPHAETSDRRDRPLFRRSSSVIVETPAKKRKLSPQPHRAPSAPPAEVLDLGSDSDDEGGPYTARRDKGKGRAVPHPPAMINLVDSDDDDALMFEAPRADQAPQDDPVQAALAGIVAAIPDVLPSYVEELLQAGQTADAIVEKLLGEGGRYPKAEGTRGLKRGWAEVEEKQQEEPEKDFLDVKKRSQSDMHYRKRALEQLYFDFNDYATADIKREFKSPEGGYFYAPAWYRLTQLKHDHKLTKISKPRKVKPMEDISIPEFDEELEWLAARVQKGKEERKQKQREEQAAKNEADRAKALDAKAEKLGTAVECQCCYGSYHPENSTECSAGCKFCKECALGNAKERLGNRLHTLPCLADCGADFSHYEARRFLPQATLELLYRIQAEKELALADLDGLEKCPFCPYAAVIENPNERLFHCEREGCGKTSCRKCKEIGHVPLSCEEAKKNKKLPALHQIELAMSEALIRRCPKCKTPCIKADGCNVLTCGSCRTARGMPLEYCYCCGAEAGHGSSHYAGVGTGLQGKCPQFDDTEKRNYEEVEAARKAALAKLGAEDLEALQADADKIAAVAPDRPPRAAPPLPRAIPLPDPQALYGYGAAYLQQLQQWGAAGLGGYGGGGGYGGFGGFGAGVGGAAQLGGAQQVQPPPPPLIPPYNAPQQRVGQVVGGQAAALTAEQRRARAAEAAARRIGQQ